MQTITRALVTMLAAAAVALPTAAVAQTTGTIAGHVFDQSGAPIRGVKVTASAPTQIGGTKTVSTDDDGAFRIVALSPGQFTVTTSAPKLKSTVLDRVRVTPGATTEIDVVMEVETAEEQVRVVERPPTIDTSRATVGESFDAEFVDQLPLASRDYQGIMALTPGVTDRFGTGNPNVRGGTYFNNSYSVDGFQTTDPVTHTFGTNFSFTAIANMEVQTAAFSAENSGVLGGVSNIVTKSGSNKFELQTTGTYTDQHLYLFKDARDTGSNSAADVSLNVGGPVVRDRLWYFASAQLRSFTFTLPLNPSFPRHPTETGLFFDGLAKLTWQLNPRNKLELLGLLSPARIENTSQSYLVEAEAEGRARQSTQMVGLTWHSVPGEGFYLVTRASFRNIQLWQDPESCKWDPSGCSSIAPEFDVSSGYLRRNASAQQTDFRRAYELGGSLDYFKNTRHWGSHDFKIGGRFEGHYNPAASTIPGDAIYFNNGSDPLALRAACANDPKEANGACRAGWIRTLVTGQGGVGYLADAFKPTRYLTIIPSLSLNYGHSSDDRERIVTDIVALAPRIQATWDATHDGRTVLRGSFANNVDTGFLALARFSSRELYTQTCFWDPDARAYLRNCRAAGGNSATTVGLPCGPDGLNPDGTSCRTTLRAPRSWEYTIGGEREILTGIAAGADFIYRHFTHEWEDLETNGNWNKGGTDLRRDGSWKSGRSEFIFDLETPDQAYRRYASTTVFLRKREGVFKLRVSYTWSRYYGTSDEGFVTNYLDNPGQAPYFYGPLPSDIRHDVRVLATYRFLPWLTGGVVYLFTSGAPYNRFLYDSAYQSFSAFGAHRGYDTRGTLNPDDDVALRLPDISQLGVQLRGNLRQFTGQSIDVFLDVQNLMALRTTLDVVETDGPFWGTPLARLPPTQLRVGAAYRF